MINAKKKNKGKNNKAKKDAPENLYAMRVNPASSESLHRVRRFNSFGSEELGQLNRNEVYNFTEIRGDWAKISSREYDRINMKPCDKYREGWSCIRHSKSGGIDYLINEPTGKNKSVLMHHDIMLELIPGPPVMARQLSSGSSDVLEQMREFISREQESRILLGLHAIKWAQIAKRITTEEKNILKRQMVEGSSFDLAILSKLTLGERTALEDLSDGNGRDRQRKLAAEIEKIGFSAVSVNIIERRELEMLRKLHRDLDPTPKHDANLVALPSTDALCCICFESFKVSDGIQCLSLHDRHFQCKECFTHYVEMLNSQKDASPHLFRSRQGGIRCAAQDCQSVFFSRAQVCGGLNSDAVMEVYLENLQHLKGLELYADYQLQLLQAMDDIRLTNARINEKAEATAEAAAEAEAKRIAAEREMKRLELESFAQTLRNEMPDARQCGKCGFGPVAKKGCDDLKRHDKEVVAAASAGDKKAGQYDNTCKSCGWFGVSWERDWKPWDGKLPVSLRGDIEVSAKLLSTRCADGHEGEWRDHRGAGLRLCCSLDSQPEGMLCRHGSDVIRSSHWSCCGSENADGSRASGAAVAVSLCVQGHQGEWRESGVTTQHCSLAHNQEGEVCVHPRGIISTSHWSCCGSREGPQDGSGRRFTPDQGVWSCLQCTFFNNPRRRVCEACRGDRGAAVVVQPDSVWSCVRCTFENSAFVPSCEVCNTARPST